VIGTPITFVHATTGEEKTVTVETVVGPIVTVRWGLAGLYELDVRTGILKAYSQKTRKAHQRGPLPWVAQDLAAIKKAAKIEVDGEDRAAITARLSAEHHANMPLGKSVSGADAMIARFQRSSTYGKAGKP
jgi:hypothetical protein